MEPRTRIVPVELADGTKVLARASMLGGEEDVGALDRALSFTQVTAIIESIARTLSATIEKVKPDKASVEFGIELAIESGQLSALIVQGSATGSLKITLEWEK